MDSLEEGTRPAVLSLVFLFVLLSSHRKRDVHLCFHFMPLWSAQEKWI